MTYITNNIEKHFNIQEINAEISNYLLKIIKEKCQESDLSSYLFLSNHEDSLDIIMGIFDIIKKHINSENDLLYIFQEKLIRAENINDSKISLSIDQCLNTIRDIVLAKYVYFDDDKKTMEHRIIKLAPDADLNKMIEVVSRAKIPDYNFVIATNGDFYYSTNRHLTLAYWLKANNIDVDHFLRVQHNRLYRTNRLGISSFARYFTGDETKIDNVVITREQAESIYKLYNFLNELKVIGELSFKDLILNHSTNIGMGAEADYDLMIKNLETFSRVAPDDIDYDECLREKIDERKENFMFKYLQDN